MARVAWILEDLVTSETYSWEINPKDLTLPRRKSMSYMATAAPGGRVVAYEGRDEPRKMSYSGTILTEEQYDNLTSWFEKRNLLKLTDDLGREYGVYVTSFEVQRSFHSAQFPWRHNYSGEMLLIDWAATATYSHTFPALSVSAVAPEVISGFESGNGMPAGTIADLVTLNPSGVGSVTSLNGSGWNLDEWDGKTYGAFYCNFGPIGDVGELVDCSFDITFTSRGGAPAPNSTVWVLLVDLVGPANPVATVVFSCQTSHNEGEWTADGQTVNMPNDFTDDQPGKMNNYLDDIGSGDCEALVIITLDDSEAYLPGIDYILFNIVGTA